MEVSIIYSSDLKNGIGFNNQINFIKEDMNYFRSMTANSIVVFGYNTFKSFKPPEIPLSGRINLLLTTKKFEEKPGSFYYSDEKNFIKKLRSLIDLYKKPVFIIGGSKTFDFIYSLSPDCIKIRNIYNTYFNPDISNRKLISEISMIVIKNRKKIKITFLHYSLFKL